MPRGVYRRQISTRSVTDQDAQDRFWGKVEKSAGCWRWIGTISVHGYGSFKFAGQPYIAHRLAYLYVIGAIPDGLTLDHLCHNKICVNPSHLEVVTLAENSHRAHLYGVPKPHASQTHCKNGHEFSEQNTYVWHNMRRCRACAREYAAIRRVENDHAS